jgi:hypothetical protein
MSEANRADEAAAREVSAKVSAAYRAGGTVCGLLAVVLAFVGPVSNVQHKVVTGVAVFAVLYVIAHSVERAVEFVVALLNLIGDSPGKVKESALRHLGLGSSTLNGNPTEDDIAGKADDTKAAQKKVDEARKDVAFLGLGLSILLCVLAVNALNYGFLDALGTTGVDGDLDRLLTALAAAGGSAGVHELVGRLQKGKEASEAAAKAV